MGMAVWLPSLQDIGLKIWLILGAAVVFIAGLIIVLALFFGSKENARDESTEASEAHSTKASEQKPAENYELITDRIRRVEKKYKSILFAAADIASLPVTIPVNVAMQLAQQNKRCLLIDADLKRDAVAKAFEIGAEAAGGGLRVKAFQTELKNLWVWPAHNFTRVKQMNVKPIVTKALEKFDFVLINAPSLMESPDRRQIASAAQAALVFGESATQATNLAQLIKSTDCTLIGNIQIPRTQAS